MSEILTALILPATAYLLCLAALCSAAWLATCYALPNYCRGGLKLALVLMGQVALNAGIVQALGLLGKLRTEYYLVTCALIGGLSLWCLQRWFPGRSLLRLVRHQVRLWIWATPFGLGLLGAGIIGFLAIRCSLVEGVDSLSIHGPMIVEWLQTAKIPLLWHYNYPLCWEYQFAANMMLMGSDVLVVVPRVMIVVTLLLMLKEVGCRIGLGGALSQLTAWLSALTPLVFGIHGQGAFKNDAALAVGLLACLLAVDRLWRGHPGGFWALQLGVFLAIGMKSTGLILGLGFLVLGSLIAIWHARKELRPKRVGWVLVGILLLQATPLALPMTNLVENGSPFFPIVMEVGDWIKLPGKVSLKGTSILEHRKDPGIWRIFATGAGRKIGFETPLLWLVLGAAVLWWTFRWGGLLLKQGPRAALFDRSLFPLMFYSVAVMVLWLMFLATPWTAGIDPESLGFVSSGGSLRYALAAVGLTYLLSIALLRDVLGVVGCTRLVILMLPVAFYQRWNPALFHLTQATGVRDSNFLLIAFLTTLAGLWALGRLMPRLDRALRESRLGEAGWPVAVLITLLCALPAFAELNHQLRQRTWGAFGGPSANFRKAWTYVWNEMPSGSVIACNMKQPAFNFSYFFYGPELQNRFLEARDPLAGPEQDLPPEVQYFYVTYYQVKPKQLQQAIQTLKSRGWYTVARVDGNTGALMKRGESR